MPAPRFITNDQFGAPGIYVNELAVPAPIRGVIKNTVCFVGQCVRGPVNRAVVLASMGEFEAIFGGRDYGAGGTVVGHVWRALQNKHWGQIMVVRPAAADAVVASFTLESAAGGAGTQLLRLDAANVGLWGNSVKWKVSDASDGNVNHFNLTVRYLGKDYRYENVDISATGNDNTAAVIGNDNTTLVRATKLADGRPNNSAAGIDGADTDGFTALGQVVAGYTSVAGSDGAIADSDYTGSGKAMEVANNSRLPGACLVVGRSNSAVKTKVLALAPTAAQRLWLVCPDSETVTRAAAVTEAATLRDKRVWYCFNHPYMVDPTTGAEVVEEPHVVGANYINQTDAQVHPADIENAALTKWVTRLYNDLADADRDAMDAGGVSYFDKDFDENGNLVYVFGNGVTTSLTSNDKQVVHRRVKDVLIAGLAFRARGDANKPNTPARRAARKGAYEAWLEALAKAELYVQTDESTHAPQFKVTNDKTVNQAADVQAGVQKDLVQVQLIPYNLWIDLRVEVGPDVVITET